MKTTVPPENTARSKTTAPYVDLDGGTIRRIQYFSTNRPPVASASATPTTGNARLTVTFDGSCSSDPDGDALAYAWDLDGDGAYDDSSAVRPTWTYTAQGSVTARLRVTDPQGASSTAAVTITAGNTPPSATMAGPAAGTTWRVGDVISFAGTATDAQDGTPPASALIWDLVMRHCPSNCHQPPGAQLLRGVRFVRRAGPRVPRRTWSCG